MKNSWLFIGMALGALAMLGAVGGPSGSGDLSTLQGTWKGAEIGRPGPGPATLIISSNKLEFRGADTNEWYKATIVLHEDTSPRQLIAVVTDCPAPPYVGKTANAIYRLEGKALRLSGNEPGEATMPTAFDSPGARQFLFQPEK